MTTGQGLPEGPPQNPCLTRRGASETVLRARLPRDAPAEMHRPERGHAPAGAPRLPLLGGLAQEARVRRG
eukprot:11183153-Lingulodinium_polyedra.AAC.1